ncbi:MAG: hypothetical protein JXX14_01080 [Deltaproteobacteria bacterium]|nr:hypothetical protein [Deltaproteobacteria bacterium]
MKKHAGKLVKKDWLVILGLALIHPIVLLLLYPVVGEPINLIIFVIPLAATWRFRWQIGVPIALFNSICTAVIFSRLGGQGPTGRNIGIIFFLAVSVLCVAVDYLKRFLDKNKAMAEEIEKLRQ